ncbi:MAG: Heat shock protein Hsp20 [candidate division CPR2 bacterium GW2011_GWC2_39_10]|uniref:Heat shock protein Hsp20 n=1 Tax=candidate division CPR2 bacterium GW2011_GWC2_39_10 TaxID=1618345 RepID=A0A0G0P858_UNCC2|nr:MAG: Heat shock protein Hsp20 [candidate division CPR2 bacterium GW2011_GWC2_39_10]
MDIIRWSPLSEIDEFFEEAFRPALPRKMAPAMDVLETDSDIVVITSVAGVKPEDIDITVGDDYVEVMGERREKEEEKKANIYRREISYGSFYRMTKLPKKVDREKADSEFENGILTVTMPKLEGAKPEVKTIKPRVK